MRMFKIQVREITKAGMLAVALLALGATPFAKSATAASPEAKDGANEVGPDPATSSSNPLSDAGMGGYVYYRMHCQSCHGHLGSGTKDGAPLLYTAYSKDYNARKAFHADFRTSDRRHFRVARGTRKRPGPRFNELEMIAKFLREVEAWHTMLKENETNG